MGRDFARKGRQPSRARAKTSSYHWSWLIAGTVIGILISSIAFFKLFPTFYPLLAAKTQEEAAPPDPAEPEVKKPTRAPKFDFYSLLPELEVNVPVEAKKPTPAPAPVEKDTQSTPSAANMIYRLQLASFRNFADADRLKAQMALTGMEVEIETVTLAPNDTWYRVRSAPFPDRASALNARTQLQTQSIHSLLLEERG